MTEPSALALLRDTEICNIVFHDGRRCEAIWLAEKKGFYYNDGNEVQFIPHAEISEWWPASVPW